MKTLQKVEKKEGNFCLKLQEKVVVSYGNNVYCIVEDVHPGRIVNFQKQNNYEFSEEDKVLDKTVFDELYGITKFSNNTYLILVTKSQKVGVIKGHTVFKVQTVKLVEVGNRQAHQPLLKAFQDSFTLLDLYYSNYDLTQRLQFSYIEPSIYEHSFFCNYNYTVQYQNYPYEILKKFIFGYASTKQVESQGILYQLSLVSRGNFNSMGRRWLRRGLNQDGYACTHFQSEMIVEIRNEQKEEIYSMVQMRASMPILWCQTPNFNGTAPFVVSRDQPKITAAMKKYFDRLEKLQKKVKIVNLVNKTGIQGVLGKAYEDYFKHIRRQNSQYFWWDYTAQYKANQIQSYNRFVQILRPDMNDFGYFKMSKPNGQYDYDMKNKQEGIFRINCIDCLDRSNFIECLIGKIFLLEVLDDWKNRKGELYFPLERVQNQELQKGFKELWGDNARAVATQSSGTPAMKMDSYSDGRRKFTGRFVDFSVGARRYFLGHFLDFYYQNCLDLHFDKLKKNDATQPVYGSKKKPLGFMLSIAAVIGLSYGAFKVTQSRLQIQDKAKRQVASFASSFLATYIGVKLIKWNSDYFVRKPIIRCHYL